MHQLLDALAYCQRRGVLHRNLKPKHLLIEMRVESSSQDSEEEESLKVARSISLPLAKVDFLDRSSRIAALGTKTAI